MGAGEITASHRREQLEAILAELVAGNARFSAGQPRQSDCTPRRRLALLGGQRPLAAILACSDSRVGPELILDQGLGQLFVVRVAGNVVDRTVLGSLEYAVEHLGTPLVIVMGHSGCGAVTAACSHDTQDPEQPKSPLRTIIDSILPSVAAVRAAGDAPQHELVERSAKLNVARQAELLLQSRILREAVAAGEARIVRAWYDQETGLVTWL